MLIIADNQEHNLTGGSLKSFSRLTDRLVTSVGLRSPLANVGGRLLMKEALKFGREQGAELVLHLGDATDISCENELNSVFKALDEEIPNHMWFMSPGNHDGLLAGNFANYQDPVGFIRKRPLFYNNAPLAGFGTEKNIWFNGCQSPTDPSAADMPRGRAIELYVNNLKQRSDTNVKNTVKEMLEFKEKGVPIYVPCRIEEIENKPLKMSSIDGYKAFARICESQPVLGRSTKIGQYAGFIVQRIDVGETRIVLLDTSDYIDPTKKIKGILPIAIFGGEITKAQETLAESFFKYDNGETIDRRRVIVAGHHPFSQLPNTTQKWIAEKSGRYISAHVHASASLIPHNVDRSKLMELNVGSTLDYPPQAIIAEINSHNVSVRAIGEDTKWDGFLKQCIERKNSWMLNKKTYENYHSGLYVNHLLKALRKATDMHDARIGHSSLPLEIPTGKNKGDWERLDKVLQDINNANGESRMFWACQAYYASKKTKKERGFLAEGVIPLLGQGFKKGDDYITRTSGWVPFLFP